MKAHSGLLKKISEEFARGNLDYSAAYLATDVRWNVLGEDPVIGKEEVLLTLRMSQLQSFPVIRIKTVIAEGDYVVIESTGEAKTLAGEAYNQTYCEVFRFAGDTIQDITTYLDTALSRDVSTPRPAQAFPYIAA